MHIRDISLDALPGVLLAHGFARPQILAHRLGRAIHVDGAMSWDAVPVGWHIRDALAKHFELTPLLEPTSVRDAADGATRKWMFRLRSGETIEAVSIRHHEHHTLCVSSQAGCAMACTFCATGFMGLRRNLTAGEITETAVRASRDLGARIDDVVFMGMGEPLHNYDAVMDACTNLNHRSGHGVSRKRITVSTSGLIREIRRFTEEKRRWRLHLSLHSAIQETRERIMPIARTNPLPELLDAIREHQAKQDVRWLTFQYVTLPGVNMDQEHVDAMARELRGIRYILNVIPWNDTGSFFRAPTWDEVKDFTTKVRALNCPVKVRYSAGKQDGMGCGQLAAETLTFTPAESELSGHMAAPPGIFTV